MNPLGISVDILLNVIWFALGVAATGVLAISEVRKQGAGVHGRLRRITAVLVLTLALFPMVSASDDELSFSLFRTQGGSRGGLGVPTEEREKSDQNLARLFDGIEYFQIQAIWTLSVALCFFAIIGVTFIARRERFLVSLPGRAPPVVA